MTNPDGPASSPAKTLYKWASWTTAIAGSLYLLNQTGGIPTKVDDVSAADVVARAKAMVDPQSSNSGRDLLGSIVPQSFHLNNLVQTTANLTFSNITFERNTTAINRGQLTARTYHFVLQQDGEKLPVSYYAPTTFEAGKADHVMHTAQEKGFATVRLVGDLERKADSVSLCALDLEIASPR